MPKDPRLYMTFPNDMHRHPKITRLPVEVRWAFFEMNGEARIADNDGVFAAEDAEFTWGREVLDALLSSHPTRPLLLKVGDTYVIREYAQHQQTRAEREELSEKRREAGRKGGKANAKQVLSTGSANPSKPKQSQSQSQRTTTYVSESQSLDNRAREETDTLSVVQEQMAAMAGIDVTRIQAKVNDQLGIRITKLSALALGNHILDKAAKPPDRPTSYVLGSISRSPAEIEKHIYDSGLT